MTENSIEISIKGKWVTVPALEVNGTTIVIRGKWIKLGVIHDEAWLETALEDPEACVVTLRKQASNGLTADIFTFSQKPSSTSPKYPYYLEWDSVAAIRFSSFKQWWEKLPQETRKNVRRSQKRGVEVRVTEFGDDLIRGIIGVNNDSPVRQNTANVYYGRSFEQVRRDHLSFIDRSDFICAYLGNEVIGYAKIVYRGDVASILNFAPKVSHHDKRPANALMAKAVDLCEARGISYLTYGMFNYGHKRQSPLRQFKIRNGFGEILVPRFYIPLTTWGSLCMKLGLHRGLLGILPHSLIVLGVTARTSVHSSLRWIKSRCSSMAERPKSNRQMGCSNPPAGSNA